MQYSISMARLCAIAAAVVCGLLSSSAAQVVGDADCNGVLDDVDRQVLVSRIFDDNRSCETADVNRDGRVSAADLTARLHGPRITFIGISSPDGQLAPPLGTLEDGAVVFFSPSGLGFNIVVEAARGPTGSRIGTEVFERDPIDASRRPDLQPLVDRPLGDGNSELVCDRTRGVPPVNPLTFEPSQFVSDAINDLACRFAVSTSAASSCTQDRFGRPRFVDSRSRVQFCLQVDGFIGFPDGDTRFSVQLRDEAEFLSPLRTLVLRVGNDPLPPTFTPIPPTPTFTPSPTHSATPIHTATFTPTRTRSATRTVRTPTFTRTRTVTRTPQIPATPTISGTVGTPPPTRTHTPTRTRTPSRTSTIGRTPTPTRTGSRTRTATFTRTSPGATRTPSRTRTVTATATDTPVPDTATPTQTHTATEPPTPTPIGGLGPRITLFALATASDVLFAEPEEMQDGIPVYQAPFGSGFSLIVEARPGPSGRPVGGSSFSSFGGSPDLQIQTTRPLGDGSADVCDNEPFRLGGVPAVDPPSFEEDPTVLDVLNDLGCRFVNGVGVPVARNCSPNNACLIMENGNFGCGATRSSAQFCALMSQNLSFPIGDTLVTVRVRDVIGNVGPTEQIVVRVPVPD